jgi:stress response protein YsnF
VSDDPPQLMSVETLRLHAEQLEVQRRVKTTGTVRVSVQTRTCDHLVDEILTETRAKVEHVPVGRFVDEMPPIREEGETTVIPVVEEVFVRRLLLREEVRVTRVAVSRPHRETVTLQYQEAVVSRTPAEEATGDPAITINDKLSIKGETHGY